MVSGEGKADAVAAAVGGADPADVPAAGAVGREEHCGCWMRPPLPSCRTVMPEDHHE